MSTRVVSKVRGFTLVELLTALGIISVLAAILFAVFSRVRESGRRAVCQSNLHQISLALRQYVQDYDGNYPAQVRIYNLDNPPTVMKGWDDAIATYVKNKDVFQCPTSTIPDGNIPNSDYEYNFSRLNRTILRSTTNPMKNEWVGTGDPNLNASAVWLFRDIAVYATSEGSSMSIYLKGTCGLQTWAGTLHNEGANYAFLDGHVKWLTPEQWIEIECENPPHPPMFEN